VTKGVKTVLCEYRLIDESSQLNYQAIRHKRQLLALQEGIFERANLKTER
jgi:hypothetical protein